MTSHRALIIGLLAGTLMAGGCYGPIAPTPAPTPAPPRDPRCVEIFHTPQLAFLRSQYLPAQDATALWLSVTNRASYPDALFAPAPELPACGSNRNASRTWLDIFITGTRVYGFCGFSSSEDLAQFAYVEGRGAPANPVYITLTDRQCNAVYTSNSVMVPAVQ